MLKIDKTQKYILFFDIDGTIYFNGEITKDTINALNAVKERGHLIFLNTGRSRGFLPSKLIKPIKWDGYICGASFIEYHGKVLLKERLAIEEATSIVEFCFKNNVNVTFECENGIFDVNFSDKKFKYLPNEKDLAKFLKKFIKKYDKLKITKATFRRRLTDEETASLPVDIIHFPNYSEAFKTGYTKATGMKILSDILNIKQENVVAFGDSLNDYDMIKWAGIKVVVSHAPDKLKDIADVILDGEENAVANGLKELFL